MKAHPVQCETVAAGVWLASGTRTGVLRHGRAADVQAWLRIQGAPMR